jgi:quinol monooxygenase YgiN
MYGSIAKFTAAPGKRDELLSALTDGSEPMPGCLSYVIAIAPSDENAIWITEVWDTKEHHEASLNIPWVQAAIARAMPLIAGMEQVAETEPVSGLGLDESI